MTYDTNTLRMKIVAIAVKNFNEEVRIRRRTRIHDLARKFGVDYEDIQQMWREIEFERLHRIYPEVNLADGSHSNADTEHSLP
jgi:DNA-binding Xre family transcriptional regulator